MKRVPLLVGLATCAFVVTQMSPTAQAQIIPLPRAEIEDRIEMAREARSPASAPPGERV